MADPRFFRICNGCPNGDWCRTRGCIAWNDDSRHRYERAKRRSKEISQEIDELEKLFGKINQ